MPAPVAVQDVKMLLNMEVKVRLLDLEDIILVLLRRQFRLTSEHLAQWLFQRYNNAELAIFL